METVILSFASLALVVLGVFMVLCPAMVIMHDREIGEETLPPTIGEIRWTRIIGLALIAGGCHSLYSILVGMPGAEFFPC